MHLEIEEVQENAHETRTEEGVDEPMRGESSTKIPGPPPLSIQLPPSSSSFDQDCAPTQAPTLDPGCLGHLPYDQLRGPRKQHRYHRKDAKEVLKTLLDSMQDQPASIGSQNLPMDADTPETSAAKRGRPTADVAEHLQGTPFASGNRCKRDALCAASLTDKEVVTGRAQKWNSDSNPQVDA